MLCHALQHGDIKIRNGPYPQEVFSLVSLSPLSSSLPDLCGKFGIYTSFLPHTLEFVFVILIFVASFSFPIVVGIYFLWSSYMCMSEIGAPHWMSMLGFISLLGLGLTLWTMASLKEKLVMAEARRKAWLGLLQFLVVNIGKTWSFHVGFRIDTKKYY